MRTTFVNTLVELAEKDKNIYLLTGDLGFGVLESFIQKFPERFVNCGVAEQNMMGMAAGLALEGKKPYVYSIVPFVTMRCFEQIRDDVCYQNLDVKIVGVGGGLDYGHLGATHHAIEDLAILRVLPNMSVFSPADPVETKALVLESYQKKGPVYFRLCRGKNNLYDFSPEIKIGKPSVFKEGADGAIVSTGPILSVAREIVEKLKVEGYNFKLISMHTLKPIDEGFLFSQLKEIKSVFTIEEHNIIGGLGSAVAEILIENGWSGKFKRIAVPDKYVDIVGESDFLRKKFDIESEKILEKILH